MKYKEFENHINESYLHDTVSVDTDALIANLGLPIDEKIQNKWNWWMLTGLALITLLLIGLVYYFNTSTNQSDRFSVVANESIVSAINLAPAAIETTKSNDDIDTEVEANTIQENLANDEVPNDEVPNNHNNEIRENRLEATQSKSQVNIKEDQNQKNTLFESANHVSTNEKLNHIVLAQTSTDSKNIAVSETSEINVLSQEENKDINRLLQPIDKLHTTSAGVKSNEVDLRLPEDPECPSFSYRIPWKIALLAEVGYMNPMKDLRNVSEDTSAIFRLRERNEKSKEAIQVGLHAKISKANSRFYARAGAAYTRIAEEMTEQYDYTELDTTLGIISITVSMTGDTVTAIYGDIVSEIRYTGRSVKHYYLHLWDIPVAVGYEMPVGSSFYAGAELGAQFNFKTTGSGLIINGVNDYSELSDKETKVGMSYFGGIHFGKHLTSRSSIQVSARFRYYPSYFTTVDPNIEQRYKLAGLHAGYVFRF